MAELSDLPAALRAAADACPAPEAAAEAFSRLLSQPGAAAELERANPEALRLAAALLALGGASAELILAAPQRIAILEAALDGDEAALELGAVLPGGSPQDGSSLREARKRWAARIAAAELSDPSWPTARSAAWLSALAAAVLEATLARHEASALAVIAMGKLGGWELNHSSDIDLLFVSPEAQSHLEGRARKVVAELEAPRAPGRLYRVDLRLRPYGRAGALAPSISAITRYYSSKARPWERQALVRARVVAGDRALGEQLLAALQPILWEQDLSQQDIHDLLSLRERTRAHTPDLDEHLKQGPGGIREIEFVTQLLQLLHGKARPELRLTSTPEALSALAGAGILSAEEARDLAEAYGFQRKLEHLLQLRTDREHELLPAGVSARAHIAGFLGLGAAELDARLAGHRERAHALLSALLGRPFDAASEDDEGALRDLLLRPDAELERGAELLAKMGFRDGKRAFRGLLSLGRERNPFLAPSGRARTLLAGLAPRLLAATQATPEPDRTLANLALAVDTLGAKATFLQLLLQDDDTLPLFISLAAQSDFLIQTLARQPKVLDEVLDRLQTRSPISAEELARECEAALEREHPEEGLATLTAVTTLLVGIHDLSGRSNTQNIGRDLSLLADALLGALLSLARREVTERHGGEPGEGGRLEMAVIAVGKLGARELSYGSDFDVILVHEAEGAFPDGAPAAAVAQELAQALLKWAGRRASLGPLAPLDLRLRPAGAQGQLSCTWERAAGYYRGCATGGEAADWERLALTRGRVVTGDPALAARVGEELPRSWLERQTGPELWDTVTEMRRRQAEQAGPRNLKVGEGGLADLEFLTSAFALRYGARHRELQPPSTVGRLRELGRLGFLEPAEVGELLSAYQLLRTVEARLRVLDGQPGSSLPASPEGMRDLAMRLGYVDAAQPAAAALDDELRYHRGILTQRVAAAIVRDRARS